MPEIIFTYLNHRIEIQLPDPADDNTVYVSIYREPGTYDDTLYNACLPLRLSIQCCW